ncbi:hypothetical protein AAG570_011878 [Ranatra chinensis]|uniref:Uncharacterized protein n=1 Tax=Ranatra chinensis TaxID=642074 RepID=A0ABD0YH69_9HEMI
MASNRRNIFYKNKKEDTAEIGISEYHAIPLLKRANGSALDIQPSTGINMGSYLVWCNIGPSFRLAVPCRVENPDHVLASRHDRECNAAVGVKAFFDMMHEGPHKVMLFGAACTQVTDPIAKASKRWHLTQGNAYSCSGPPSPQRQSSHRSYDSGPACALRMEYFAKLKKFLCGKGIPYDEEVKETVAF